MKSRFQRLLAAGRPLAVPWPMVVTIRPALLNLMNGRDADLVPIEKCLKEAVERLVRVFGGVAVAEQGVHHLLEDGPIRRLSRFAVVLFERRKQRGQQALLVDRRGHGRLYPLKKFGAGESIPNAKLKMKKVDIASRNRPLFFHFSFFIFHWFPGRRSVSGTLLLGDALRVAGLLSRHRR